MPQPIVFKPGTFQTFRATTQIAMPEGLDIPSGYISMDAIIQYDGQTLKYGGGTYNVSQLRSAIKAGWFVPEADTTTSYVPQPANVAIHKATSANELRGEPMTVSTVDEEERDLGSIKSIMGREAPKAVSATEDGQVVSTIKTAAKQHTVLKDSHAATAAIRKLDNTPPPRAEAVKRAVATGDVQEARMGEGLEDILPDAESAGTPEPGMAGEGDMPHLTAEERAEALRQARLSKMATAKAAPVPEPEPEAPGDKALRDAKIAALQAVIPGFKWDMSVHWRTRVKVALTHKDDPVYMNGIMAVEIDAVKKHVQKELA